MPAPRPTRTLPRVAARASPWAVSLAVHAGLAAVGLSVVAATGPTKGTAAPESTSIAVMPVAATPPTPISSIPTIKPPSPPSSAVNVALPDRSLPPMAPGLTEVRITVAPLEPPAPATLPLDATAPDSPIASPPEMFGARGDSQSLRVVYVLDASGSMVAALPTIARELDRSLDRLSGTQWFQVIVFSGRGLESPPALGRTLTRATLESKRSTSVWLASLEPDRRGDAIGALERALRLNPDIVFLVVKGGLGDTTASPDPRSRESSLARLARATRGADASIKVIQFFDPDPSGLIEAIASTYGGGDALRFISRKDLGIE